MANHFLLMGVYFVFFSVGEWVGCMWVQYDTFNFQGHPSPCHESPHSFPHYKNESHSLDPSVIAFSQLHSLSLIPSITHTAAQTVSHSLFLSHSLSLSSSLILYSPSSHFIILVSKFTHLLFLSYSWVDRGREWWSGGGRSGGNYCVLCVVCAQCSCADVFLLIYLIKTYIGLTHFFILILIYTPVTHTHTHTL